MDSSALLDKLWKRIGPKVTMVSKRIADYMSLYPDPADLWIQLPPANSALDCALDVLALEFSLPGARTRHQTYDQRERFAKLIKQHRRQGYWKVVEELIQQPQGLIFYLEVFLKHFSPEDIFGNLIPQLSRRISSAKPRSKERLKRAQAQKVIYPSRRRGYNDKGSLRPATKWLPWNAYAKPSLPEEQDVVFYAPRPYQWIPRRQ